MEFRSDFGFGTFFYAPCMYGKESDLACLCHHRKDKRVQQDNNSSSDSVEYKLDEKGKKSKQKRRIVQTSDTTPTLIKNNIPDATPTAEVSVISSNDFSHPIPSTS